VSKKTLNLQTTGPNDTHAEVMGKLFVDGVLPLALLAEGFAGGYSGAECDLTAMHARMETAADAAASGDLGGLERMLAAQAQALNLMFTELARRASANMGQNLTTTEAYLKLAFRAQAQSRATVEALGEMKNPRAVAFVKQANFAQQQQVNNCTPAPAREIQNPQNELLEDARHEQITLDTRTTRKASRSNPAMEALGAQHRAEDGAGQSKGCGK